jgi:hypothetical protein
MNISDTIWLDMADRKLKPFDVHIACNPASCKRFMVAVVKFKCVLTDSMTFAPVELMKGTDTIFMRVFIPEGYSDQFEAIANPQYFRQAVTKVNLN